jgi:hypothetical protein
MILAYGDAATKPCSSVSGPVVRIGISRRCDYHFAGMPTAARSDDQTAETHSVNRRQRIRASVL